MLYGPTVWDPVLIIAQIVAVQCVFYLGLGLFLTALVGEQPAAVQRLSLRFRSFS